MDHIRGIGRSFRVSVVTFQLYEKVTYGRIEERIGGNEMRYCENCGAELRDSAKFCSSCGSSCEAIEAKNTVRFCENCGSKLECDYLFCPECGKPCCTLEEYENRHVNQVIGVESGVSVHSNSKNTESSSSINYLCLLLLFWCVIMWSIAPFIAINYYTLGNQPTALQLVMDDVTYLGELTESTAYWAAIASIIGIIICLISTIATANGITRFVAVLTELPLVLALYDIANWADDAEELFEALGIGFWSIFILLWIVVFVGKSDTSATAG